MLLPDGAPRVGIAFGFVNRITIGKEGFVNFTHRGVTPAQ